MGSISAWTAPTREGGKGVAGFIPRAILAFLGNPLSGATPFRKKGRATSSPVRCPCGHELDPHEHKKRAPAFFLNPTGAAGGAWRPKGEGGADRDNDPRGARPGPCSRPGGLARWEARGIPTLGGRQRQGDLFGQRCPPWLHVHQRCLDRDPSSRRFRTRPCQGGAGHRRLRVLHGEPRGSVCP